MGNAATERIWREPSGRLVSEDAATEPGTSLAYAVGDEFQDDDEKLFKSGTVPKPDTTPAGPFGAGNIGAKAEARATRGTAPNTIEVSNPVAKPAKK